jgi:hypothetical protein
VQVRLGLSSSEWQALEAAGAAVGSALAARIKGMAGQQLLESLGIGGSSAGGAGSSSAGSAGLGMGTGLPRPITYGSAEGKE